MADEDEIEVERFAEQCVLYILSQHLKNSTIKRPELVRTIMPDESRKVVKAALDRTKILLKTIHGVKLVELDENVKQYMVINAVDTGDSPLNWSDDVRKQQALLLPILAFIFMNGGSASESEIKSLLRNLMVLQNNNYNSEEFGDIERILKKDFVTQRYLNYEAPKTKSKSEESKDCEFSWGIRSKLEISKQKVLQFVSDLYEVPITHWADQFAQLNRRS